LNHRKQLLILPFDHRGSFSSKLMGFKGKLTPLQIKKISAMKMVVFDAFEHYIAHYHEKNEFGILVDEQFGEDIIEDANDIGVETACPVEKSGQEEFDFEYGKKFRDHIEEMDPSHVKCLVRYNPNNKAMNKRQLARLKLLSDHCIATKRKLLFELLVPPTEKELKAVNGDKKKYDQGKRITNTILALKEISKALYVDVWKLEGMDSKKAWQDMIKAIKQGKNKDYFSIIVLGRGENKAKVIEWLKLAAKFKEITGFAVGRTIFFQPLRDYKDQKITRATAVNRISNNFKFFVKLWLKEKKIKLK
jgi:myo-inositol catabolism protein IolC